MVEPVPVPVQQPRPQSSTDERAQAVQPKKHNGHIHKMDSRPVLLIAGCHKYLPFVEAAMKRMRRPGWRVIGLVGDPAIPAPTLNGHGILTVPVEDTYERLPLKLQAAYTWIYENMPNAPGVFKTDEDILYSVSVDDVCRFVNENTSADYWGLYVDRCNEGYINEGRIRLRFTDTSLRPKHQAATYCYGAGYWLSRRSLELVAAAREVYAVSGLEDVCTGFVLNSAGIVPLKAPFHYIEVPRDDKLLRMK